MALFERAVSFVVCRVARAGPRSKIYFDPEEVNAAIVTCGGLCPGLNDVIRQVTNNLCWINLLGRYYMEVVSKLLIVC